MQISNRIIYITLTVVMVCCWTRSFAKPNLSAREYPIGVHEMVKARLAGQHKTHQGSWGAWSAWSPCSRTCGGGVAMQSRECEPLRQQSTEDVKRRRRVPLTDRTPSTSPKYDNVTSPKRSKNQCIGVYKRFHLCNSQKCPAGTKDFRQSQCEAFNGKYFLGSLYMWEPFFDPPNPCVLNCRAVGHRFYASLNQTVVDGTACTSPSHPRQENDLWICVQGQCKDPNWAQVWVRMVLGVIHEPLAVDCIDVFLVKECISK